MKTRVWRNAGAVAPSQHPRKVRVRLEPQRGVASSGTIGVPVARLLSGKATVCKTVIRGFDSLPRLILSLICGGPAPPQILRKDCTVLRSKTVQK